MTDYSYHPDTLAVLTSTITVEPGGYNRDGITLVRQSPYNSPDARISLTERAEAKLLELLLKRAEDRKG